MTDTLLSLLPDLTGPWFAAWLAAAVLAVWFVADVVFDGWLSWMLAGVCWWVADLFESVRDACGGDETGI